jgi:uncharacterized protein
MQTAEQLFDYGGATALTDIAETNHRCLVAAGPVGFASECVDEVRANSLQRLAAVGGLLDRRGAEGKVRRCHGDLHLRNICLLDGKPTLFDCLEFSDALASIDVLYDLAFLRISSIAGSRIFPMRPRPCRLVAIGGLSGSGKSTLAAALAPGIDARVLRSDVIRKRLFGVAPETRLPASAYTTEVSRRVYEALREKAAAALAAGYSVIIDAVSLKPEERQSFVAVAKATSVPFWVYGSPLQCQQWSTVFARDATTPPMPRPKSSRNSSGRMPGRTTGLLSMPASDRKPV